MNVPPPVSSRLPSRVALLPLLIAAVATPAPAQVIDMGKIDRRVGKLESEMRAVQRKVFPGGDPRFFEPEIPAQAPPPAAAPAPAVPASNPVADLTARVDALEGQIKTMTGQIEALEYRLRQTEDSQRRLKGDVEFRLNALENPGAAAAAAAAAPTAGGAGAGPAPTTATSQPAAAASPVARPAAPTARPATADAAWTDAYARVTARDWPAAQAAMTRFLADWPKSTRVPQARFWLGRALAAQNQPAAAAKAFLDVYQTAPRSAPAPDALVGLAGALNSMAKPTDACQVLAELDSVYGAKLTDAQKADAARQRARAKCAA